MQTQAVLPLPGPWLTQPVLPQVRHLPVAVGSAVLSQVHQTAARAPAAMSPPVLTRRAGGYGGSAAVQLQAPPQPMSPQPMSPQAMSPPPHHQRLQQHQSPQPQRPHLLQPPQPQAAVRPGVLSPSAAFRPMPRSGASSVVIAGSTSPLPQRFVQAPQPQLHQSMTRQRHPQLVRQPRSQSQSPPAEVEALQPRLTPQQPAPQQQQLQQRHSPVMRQVASRGAGGLSPLASSLRSPVVGMGRDCSGILFRHPLHSPRTYPASAVVSGGNKDSSAITRQQTNWQPRQQAQQPLQTQVLARQPPRGVQARLFSAQLVSQVRPPDRPHQCLPDQEELEPAPEPAPQSAPQIAALELLPPLPGTPEELPQALLPRDPSQDDLAAAKPQQLHQPEQPEASQLELRVEERQLEERPPEEEAPLQNEVLPAEPSKLPGPAEPEPLPPPPLPGKLPQQPDSEDHVEQLLARMQQQMHAMHQLEQEHQEHLQQQLQLQQAAQHWHQQEDLDEVPEEEEGRELDWIVEQNMHPMVTEGEKVYVVQCLEALAREVELVGGLGEYLRADCMPRLELLRLPTDEVHFDAEPSSPRGVLRRCLEALLQRRARTGGDTVFVQEGYLLSQGVKKIVKMQLRCAGEESNLSVCWDWDVKLEPTLSLALP